MSELREASRAGDALRTVRLQRFVDSARRLFTGAWDKSHAEAVHAELDNLASVASAVGALYAERVAALSVYLASFVEDHVRPTLEQLQHLHALLDGVVESVSEDPSAKPGRIDSLLRVREASNGSQRVLHLQGEDIESALAIDGQLRRQGLTVVALGNIDALYSELERARPDLILLDNLHVAQIHAIVNSPSAVSGKGAPPCVVIAPRMDLQRKLYARRAGATAVLESPHPTEVAAAVDQLLRRHAQSSYRVLVVEDDRAQAQFCESILRHSGMQVELAGTPEAALAAVSEFRPDAVLMDFYLPGMNGIELTQLMREMPQMHLVPVIFLTGEQDLEKRFDVLAVGADDYLLKPIKPRHLVAAVSSRAERARQLSADQDLLVSGYEEAVLSSRTRFLHDLAQGAPAGTARALVMLALDDAEGLRQRLGLVGAARLSRHFASFAGEAGLFAGRVSAYASFVVVGLAEAEDEQHLRERLYGFQRAVLEHAWRVPGGVQCTLAAVQANAAGNDPDHLIATVRRVCLGLQGRGQGLAEVRLGSTPDAREIEPDPLRRIARTLLQKLLTPMIARPRFQPLAPLRGQLPGQFVMELSLHPPKAGGNLLIHAATYESVARQIDRVRHLDRFRLRQAMEALKRTPSGGEGLRFLVPVGADSVFDPAFAPWLRAELRGLGLRGSNLVLVCQLDEVGVQTTAANAALSQLQQSGVRVAVHADLESAEGQMKALELPVLDMVVLSTNGNARALVSRHQELISSLVQHGKLIVLCGVTEHAFLPECLRIGIHYACGSAVSASLERPDFDFSAVVG